MAEFAKRRGIEFPLLADPDSSSIANLGLVNPDAEGMTAGVAFPGLIYVDGEGKIVETFFEESYRVRPTPGSVLAKLFPETEAAPEPEQDEDYALGQTGSEGIVGSRWEVTVTFDLPEGHHLYAPGNDGYIPLQLEMEDNPLFSFGEIEYPEPGFEELLGEKVAVYTGLVRVTVPVTILSHDSLRDREGPLETDLKGLLQYQICTDTTCLLPQEVPVEWKVSVKPMDRTRSDEKVRH